ncbi:MAG: pyridoxal phosphate-dependent aminotransferase family protein [Candidatus Eisenbacteria bacterium]|uniref:Pyridoxal phosphate-dependent aminotransferase family protein n=1 Tax=Eiseniibacteriota bacterium TaxID=2212470 RepID=A0A948W6S9_UNCEI|nr:pyridoxal phosphate-dependent aminotransferase family protein [Candidatus Eisenbacteria bacterium]MBU1950558.1 pyridoxal phosphate-dependent aminotransferase family protein [Candidatus Eisenbacteria bacterium]MBU2690956.1 pyridoxal phosphate-dependent aminotransferase family protein [Candidatus Eisenbacteria bacterium]
MGLQRVEKALGGELDELFSKGTAKGKEAIFTGVIKPTGKKGPRYLLKGQGTKEFLRMNSNSYLGMSLEDKVITAEEHASREFGVGPGAVRFINGTFKAHRDLEKKLAEFHGREDAMIYSAAYATMIGVFAAMTSKETTIISDELNHNCIINAIRLSRPFEKKLYKHNNMEQLEQSIKESIGSGAKRILIVTDGIFSMRGDYAPLDTINAFAKKYDKEFPEGVVVMVDDSHGVGAYGETGRGTEEYTKAGKVDVLIGTLGKAFGVNGGYVVSSETVTRYLREKAITYIYSNPITVGEAAATLEVLKILDSNAGRERLKHLSKLTKKFEDGLKSMDYEIIESAHPIVPLMVRDTQKTTDIVMFLKENGVLGTGLNFPVVPQGDQTIRFQVNGNHTEYDIEVVLSVLADYKKKH